MCTSRLHGWGQKDEPNTVSAFGEKQTLPPEIEMSSGVGLGEKSGLSEPRDRALARGRSWERSSGKASRRRWHWAIGKYRQGQREGKLFSVERTARATYGSGNTETDACARGQKSRWGPSAKACAPGPWGRGCWAGASNGRWGPCRQSSLPSHRRTETSITCTVPGGTLPAPVPVCVRFEHRGCVRGNLTFWYMRNPVIIAISPRRSPVR